MGAYPENKSDYRLCRLEAALDSFERNMDATLDRFERRLLIKFTILTVLVMTVGVVIVKFC